MDCVKGFTEWMTHFAQWWSRTIDFPAFILLIIFVLGIYVLWRTQQADNDFDFSFMLKDDNDKPSSARLAMFVCLAITSWGLMYIIITRKGDIDAWLFLGYTAIWSGTKVAETAIVAYANRSKPPTMSNGNGMRYEEYGHRPTAPYYRGNNQRLPDDLPDDGEHIGNQRVMRGRRVSSDRGPLPDDDDPRSS